MEQQVVTQEMVERVLRTLQQPGINNAPVLGVNILRMQQAKNAGFPHDMYHSSLLPVTVINHEQEQAMLEHGYGMTYIMHQYPRWFFRRNMDVKFETQNDRANSVGDFIEQRLVRSAEDETVLLKRKVDKGCSAWVSKIAMLEPLPDAPEEDPNAVIARLQGQLEEAQRKADKKEKAAA